MWGSPNGWEHELRSGVIAGEPDSAMAKELLHAAHSVSQPSKIVLRNTGAVELLAKMLMAENETTVFVCVGNARELPTSDAAILKKLFH